jgi:2-desacetyl-2-hydroxyethyl bacteriochlorophyllide A dehydrogenase
MLQLSYMGGRHLVVEEVTERPLRHGELRVKIHSVGICKSDIYGYSGLNDRRDSAIGPGEVLVMGHEASGTVQEVGPGASGPAAGAEVAVNPIYGCGSCELCDSGSENLCARRTVMGCAPDAPGGYAESIVVPSANVVQLPPGTSLEHGALAEPLSVGAHGVGLAGLNRGTSVLVIGGGIIGIGAALAARRRTEAEVLVLEPQPERRELCRSLGLTAVSPGEGLGSLHVDVALDCVARPETFAAAIEAVPPAGLVVLVGIWEDFIPLPVSVVVWRETRIFGSYGFSRDDFADVVAWIGSGEVDLTPLIEHRVGFGDVIGAFEAYTDGSLNAVRTLMQPAL